MTREQVQDTVGKALASVAPEIDVAALEPRTPLRDQVDLDSMDFLRFVVELHKQFSIDVPETDYAKLTTLAGIVTYVEAGLQAHQ